MNCKGEVALGIVLIVLLSVYLLGWINGDHQGDKTDDPTMKVVSSEMNRNDHVK